MIKYFILSIEWVYYIPTLLSTQMALLRSSANIPYVGAQKDILGLKIAKTL